MPRPATLVLLALLAFTATSAPAAGRELAPPPFGPSAYDAGRPSVAFAAGRFLTVWAEEMGYAGYRILGSFSDAAGRRVSPAAFFITTATRREVHLVATGESFALFWPSPWPVHTLQMADLDAAGRITATREVAVPGHALSTVTWNGAHFVAQVTYPAQEVSFDRGGTILHAGPPRPSRYAATAALRDGGMVVAWADGPVLRSGVVNAAGALAQEFVVARDYRFTPLHLARTARGFLLVFLRSDAAVPPRHEVFAVDLRIDGSPSGPPAAIAVPGSGAYGAASSERATLLAVMRYTYPRELVTVAIGQDGHVSAQDRPAIVRARQTAPVVGSGAGNLVAVWSELTGATSRVRTAALTAYGEPFLDRVVAEDARLVSRELAWNGVDFLAVLDSGGKLRAQRVSATGEAVGRAAILGDTSWNATAAVAWAGDRWVVFWPAARARLLYASVLPDGTVAAVREQPRPARFPRRGHPDDVAVAFDGARGIMVWREAWVPQCNILCPTQHAAYAVRIDRDGMLLDPEALLLEESGTQHISVATNGSQHVVVHDFFSGSGVFGEQVTATIIDAGALRVLSSTPLGGGVVGGWSAVAADGDAFVIATRRARELLVRRVARDGSFVSARSTAVLAPHAMTAPGVAVPLPGNAIIVIEEANARDGARAVVYSERDLQAVQFRRRRSARIDL